MGWEWRKRQGGDSSLDRKQIVDERIERGVQRVPNRGGADEQAEERARQARREETPDERRDRQNSGRRGRR